MMITSFKFLNPSSSTLLMSSSSTPLKSYITFITFLKKESRRRQPTLLAGWIQSFLCFLNRGRITKIAVAILL